MPRAVIGLGANLGRPERAIQEALDALGLVPGVQVRRRSRLYRTSPVGGVPQPDFLNAVAEVETTLSPHALLGVCLGIEAALGRVRNVRFGPRCIDLDVLGYEGQIISTPELTLPHPRIQQRLFVTVPLRELYPDGNAPGFRFSVDPVLTDRVELWRPFDGKTHR